MKKYGIWGLGIVGKSVLRFLQAQGHIISVYDSRPLTAEKEAFLKSYRVNYYAPENQEAFFQENDFIVPSPGIPLGSAKEYIDKIVHELDLFGPLWHKPLIAVTGSLGKTTLVTLLHSLLTANDHPVATGGNIGTPMLDLLARQDMVTYGLLELSSFQLEYADTFAPDLAIITNLYANHLDRHGTMEDYFHAKAQIFAHQRPEQKMLVPFGLAKEVRKLTKRPCTYFASEEQSVKNLELLKEGDSLYTLKGATLTSRSLTSGMLVTTRVKIKRSMAQKGDSLLHETWLILLTVCDMLGLLSSYSFKIPQFLPLEHRIEFVGNHNGILFYNDSKSTIVEATKAAVLTLASRPIHLILGGTSKGVDRAPLIAELKPYITSVACFGKEAQELDAHCKRFGITTSDHTTLDDALKTCLKRAKKDDVILLSPSGASYDLYKDYQERGRHFKSLVEELST
jgi:UDP-N-acetylmuramoylalanine--D-glutamate ligase